VKHCLTRLFLDLVEVYNENRQQPLHQWTDRDGVENGADPDHWVSLRELVVISDNS
jgi:hypothetical protein